MIRRLAFACVTLVALSAPAFAQGAGNQLRDWGLLGVWSARCDLPASRANNHFRYVISADGRAWLERDFGNPEQNDRSEIVSAVLRPDGTLALTIDFTSISQVRLNVYTKVEGRVRVIYNRGPNDDVSVENGILKHNGQPTPWSSRCS